MVRPAVDGYYAQPWHPTHSRHAVMQDRGTGFNKSMTVGAYGLQILYEEWCRW